GNGVRRVVEAVDEFEAERDQQRDEQQYEREDGCRRRHRGEIADERGGCIDRSNREDSEYAKVGGASGPSRCLGMMQGMMMMCCNTCASCHVGHGHLHFHLDAILRRRSAPGSRSFAPGKPYERDLTVF